MKRRRNRYKNKNKNIFNIRSIPMLAVVLVLLLSVGFSTEKIQLKLSNIGGTVTLEKNDSEIMLSNFSASSNSSGGISTYANYSSNKLKGGVTLPNADSTVTYKMEITNLGNEIYGIYDIINNNPYIDYELSGYNLKDKICDDNDKCNLGVEKDIYITIKYKDSVYEKGYASEYVINKPLCIEQVPSVGLDASVCDLDFDTFVNMAMEVNNVTDKAQAIELLTSIGMIANTPIYNINYDTCVTVGSSMGITEDESKSICSGSYSNLLFEIQKKFQIDSYQIAADQLESMGVISKKTLESMNYTIDFELPLDFKVIYTITYTGIVNHDYPTGVIDGGTVVVNFVEDIPEVVSVSTHSGVLLEGNDYIYDNELTIYNVNSNLTISPGECFVSYKPGEINDYRCSNPNIVIEDNLSLPVAKIVSSTFDYQRCLNRGSSESDCNNKKSNFDSATLEEQINTGLAKLKYKFNSNETQLITKIGLYAFAARNITSVNLSDDITFIDSAAFSVNNISTLEIPSSVETIGDLAFAQCNINTLTINTGLKTIGGMTFYNNNLTDLVIPNSVVSIGTNAFMNNQIHTLTLGNSLIDIGQNSFASNLITSVIIPDSVVSIGTSAFMNNQIHTLTLGNSLIDIGSASFKNNLITSVIIPDSVVSIGTSAFSNNEINNLYIGSGLTEINKNVFFGNRLTSVEIPDNVVTIASGAFNSNNLTSVKIGSGIKNIDDSFSFGTDSDSESGRTWGPNQISSVEINASKRDVTMGTSTFGWITGKSNNDIIWLKDIENINEANE